MNPQESKNGPPSLAPSIPAIEAGWETVHPRSERLAEDRDGRPTQAALRPRLNLKTPVIVRSETFCRWLGIDRLPAEIRGKLAAMIKGEGGAWLAETEDLANVPLRDLPFRISPVTGQALPNQADLISADAIELQLGNWAGQNKDAVAMSLQSLRLIWPCDVPDLPRLAKKIGLLRVLSESSVPVGLAVPMADISEDAIASFEWLAESGIDFVTVRTAAACLGSHHPALKYFAADPVQLTQRVIRMLDRRRSRSIAVFIDHPWSDGYQAAQALLAGASVVGVDGYLTNSIPTASRPSSSLSRTLPSLEWDHMLEIFTRQLLAVL